MRTAILLAGLLIANACHTETSIKVEGEQRWFFAAALTFFMIMDIIEFFAKLIRKYGN